MRVIVGLGGNALLRRGEPMTASNQRHNVKLAARALAPVATRHGLVISHGNGPQVGLLALQAEAYEPVEAYPLDVLGAESEGMIGYLIEQELGSLLPGRTLATVLTMVEVDARDPAFDHPTTMQIVALEASPKPSCCRNAADVHGQLDCRYPADRSNQ